MYVNKESCVHMYRCTYTNSLSHSMYIPVCPRVAVRGPKPEMHEEPWKNAAVSFEEDGEWTSRFEARRWTRPPTR